MTYKKKNKNYSIKNLNTIVDPGASPEISDDAYYYMKKWCPVHRCKNRSNKYKDKRFFTFPRASCAVGLVRRTLWLNAIHKKNLIFHSLAVCSDHFVFGCPSPDPNHPDYIPSVNMGAPRLGKAYKSKKSRKKKIQKKTVVFLDDSDCNAIIKNEPLDYGESLQVSSESDGYADEVSIKQETGDYLDLPDEVSVNQETGECLDLPELQIKTEVENCTVFEPVYTKIEIEETHFYIEENSFN